MNIHSKSLIYIYGAIAITALVSSQLHIINYYPLGVVDANIKFWKDTLVSNSSRFITIDILFLSLAACTWMLLEANKLKIRNAWIYIIVGLFIGISFAFPLFLMRRERLLAKENKNTISGKISITDAFTLVMTAAFSVAYTYISFRHF
jgi:hypothetical protein